MLLRGSQCEGDCLYKQRSALQRKQVSTCERGIRHSCCAYCSILRQAGFQTGCWRRVMTLARSSVPHSLTNGHALHGGCVHRLDQHEFLQLAVLILFKAVGKALRSVCVGGEVGCAMYVPVVQPTLFAWNWNWNSRLLACGADLYKVECPHPCEHARMLSFAVLCGFCAVCMLGNASVWEHPSSSSAPRHNPGSRLRQHLPPWSSPAMHACEVCV